ncbi:hypothetical protein Q8F55_004183 [Vanrija albida]|uniref:Methyltransferase type 11 domain-containing protein n=1 Tax=Vanrija albida TaxID=181172 RepID=A0ABR3Q760_9TREE
MNLLLLLAAIPLIWRLALPFIPEEHLDPYRYWNSTALNTHKGGFNEPTLWRNLGYWDKPNSSFTQANERLARKLLQFADAKKDGNTLDVAHGAGDSLLIHLESNPAQLHALTSLEDETLQARRKLFERAIIQKLNGFPYTTEVKMHTLPATYKPGVHNEHPLNPMRGFVGGGEAAAAADEEEEEPAAEDDAQATFSDDDDASASDSQPPANDPRAPFDLVYVLDSVYHFPPSVEAFAAQVLPALRKGSGVLAYTDALPPPSWSSLPLSLVGGFVAPLLAVPPANLSHRPKTLDEYKALLERVGYTDVRVEDWSEHVWHGIADNLTARGGWWGVAGRVFGFADKTGWRYVAVRAVRPAQAAPKQE